MKIRSIVNEVLKQREATFAMLAEEIGMSETLLDEALQNEYLQIRILELISKELRVPLYSFFRSAEDLTDYSKQKMKYYTVDISKLPVMELHTEVDILKKEIAHLQKQLEEKETMLKSASGL